MTTLTFTFLHVFAATTSTTTAAAATAYCYSYYCAHGFFVLPSPHTFAQMSTNDCTPAPLLHMMGLMLECCYCYYCFTYRYYYCNSYSYPGSSCCPPRTLLHK